MQPCLCLRRSATLDRKPDKRDDLRVSVIAGWGAIGGGIGLVVASWTHRLDERPSWQLFAAVGVLCAIWLLLAPIFAGTLGVFFAFSEPFVLVAVVISLVTGQWVVAGALLLIAFVCDMGRRSAAAAMDMRAKAGMRDPAWPQSPPR
jgi:hypothetical protein